MADYHAFMPLPSSAPAFLVNVSSTGSVFRLETSASVARVWGSPTNRWIRVSSSETKDLWISFGTTAASDLPVVGSHMMLQMPGDHVIPVLASKPGVSMIVLTGQTASTDVAICLGTVLEY